ncbi:MAG: helix-turn-helix domain-containing protein [Lachnospiraceae bacterium]|nr:helix-turn-helix domain-containing protein [Lachnospiraceae bacterium]
MEKEEKKKLSSGRIRRLPATEERQYLIDGDYEVYEKEGVPTGAMAFHYHNFYEILYVLEGEYSSMVETQSYLLHKGDFLLIDQNVMHKYQPTGGRGENSKRIILWVTGAFLRRLTDEDMDLTECFRIQDSRAWHFPVYYEEMLRGYLLKLAMDGASTGIRRAMDRGYLTLFFSHLNLLCARKESLLSGEYVAQHPLVEKVNAYVEEHLEEPITLEQLAEHVHVSKYHFLRKFKELTGVTAHEFVMNKRLIRACELLQKGESVTSVYQSTGFSDYSVFLRNFRSAFGISPSQYRG